VIQILVADDPAGVSCLSSGRGVVVVSSWCRRGVVVVSSWCRRGVAVVSPAVLLPQRSR
jgi:hypothetical protein